MHQQQKIIQNPFPIQCFCLCVVIFFVSASFFCYFGVSPAILRGQQRTTDPSTDMRTLAILCTSRLESLVALVGGLACAPLVPWSFEWDPISWLPHLCTLFRVMKNGICFWIFQKQQMYGDFEGFS